ncbi:MAG: alpha-L-fucosidase [Bacteroidetes bacterium]|nr:alpha-L-fucosidase [Bacteroidota bacterium]MBU1116947.1 alpha-L-fucosidase [Bacteroidota bacterium]MBU1799120.1 alpha-L-fucosidase [Bacteroidota bacterium]
MKENIKILIVLVLVFCCSQITAQQINGKNFVLISNEDSNEEIIAKAANLVPTAQQYNWQKLEFTAFVHFGINTFTNREWGLGNEDPAIFNPEKLDTEQWIRTFKEAGIKLAILTAKHHDGFCLWPTKYTEHSVKNSPWKNGNGDVVREFVDACRKYGIKVGLYLSPWDRNNKSYGDSPKYNEFYLNQLSELLTNYGEIEEVWFDGANGEGKNGKKQVYDWQSYYSLIRKLQPNAVTFGMSPDVRWVGTETGYGRESEWSVIPIDLSGINIDSNYPLDEIYKPRDYVNYDLGSRDKIIKATGLFYYPAEVNTSIRPGWFYHKSQDDSVKSVKELLNTYFASVGRNGVFLLNFPPNENGLLSQNDIDTIKCLKRILDGTFSKNFAEGSTITLDSNENKLSYNSIFEEHKTLIVNENKSNAIFEFDLANEEIFDVIMLQENIRIGQRIEKFHLDFFDGNNWMKFAEGTTVGYKRLLRFNEIKAKKIRLVIEQSRLNPTINNIGLYKLKISNN